jgi:hypothetical protein
VDPDRPEAHIDPLEKEALQSSPETEYRKTLRDTIRNHGLLRSEETQSEREVPNLTEKSQMTGRSLPLDTNKNKKQPIKS